MAIERFILGGGITGLVLLELLKDKGYKVLTNKIGGQLTAPFPLGPRIIHKTKNTEKFMKRIGINAEPKVFEIGYLVDGFFKRVLNCQERQQYYTKTRNAKEGVKFNNSSLSGGKNRIIGWDMNEVNIVEILRYRNFEALDMVDIKQIDTAKSLINGKRYEHIISTIDLTTLAALTGNQLEVYKGKVCYTKVLATGLDIFDQLEDLSYVYDITDPNIKRITKLSEFIRVVESHYPLNEKQSPYKKLEEISLNSQICHELKLKQYHGIDLVGRYAQYDHDVRVDTIIDEYSWCL